MSSFVHNHRHSKTRKYFSKTISQISFTREWFTRKEFQRQSLQHLRPNSFDQDDYDDFDVAVKIFESMGLPNDIKFYWACINEFREDTFWRKYFIDRAENTFEEKVQFLQALSGFTRDDQYTGKRVSSGKPFGSPSSGGVHSGSPSSGGNNSWGQTVNGQWQPRAPQWAAQQWGAPPSMQQWGTPPTSHQWGTPPTSNQWGTTSNAQHGVHHQWLHNGVQLQLLNHGILHQWLHNGVHHQMINNGVHLQITCSMDFHLKLRPKVQELMKKELQLKHHLETYRAHVNQGDCSIFGAPNGGFI
uniref:Uncharacterized protein n=1 Tax=Brassica oleracea TaxID=3712 RepID=A0A3P6EM48_BRAOL|nr:unnamed protein product [Brassica oleracea]